MEVVEILLVVVNDDDDGGGGGGASGISGWISIASKETPSCNEK